MFRFLRDWDNHATTIFNRSQLAYLESMPEPRAWGAGCPVDIRLARIGAERRRNPHQVCRVSKIHEVGFE